MPYAGKMLNAEQIAAGVKKCTLTHGVKYGEKKNMCLNYMELGAKKAEYANFKQTEALKTDGGFKQGGGGPTRPPPWTTGPKGKRKGKATKGVIGKGKPTWQPKVGPAAANSAAAANDAAAAAVAGAAGGVGVPKGKGKGKARVTSLSCTAKSASMMESFLRIQGV